MTDGTPANLDALKSMVKECVTDDEGNITINEKNLHLLMELSFNRGQSAGLQSAKETINNLY